MNIDFLEVLFTVLLGVIAFFLRQIYSEFRKTRDEIVDIKTQVATMQIRVLDFWSSHEKEHTAIEKRLENHGQRIGRLEVEGGRRG